MDEIINGRLDIYAALGVAPDASGSEISKKYRQMALRYHPDKNTSAEAPEKFQFFSAINTVLQDPGLRHRYDEIRRQRSTIQAPNVAESVQNQILRFKEELRARENEARKSKIPKVVPGQNANVSVLSMKGLRLRRELQASLQQKHGYVSFRDIDVPQHTTDFLVRAPVLEVVWKFRPEASGQIDTDTLRRIFDSFGPVKSCEVKGNDGRYVKGTVVFVNTMDAEKAISHDYGKADLWNGTPVRKLASLLRGVKRSETSGADSTENSMWGFDDEISHFVAVVNEQKVGVAMR